MSFFFIVIVFWPICRLIILSNVFHLGCFLKKESKVKQLLKKFIKMNNFKEQNQSFKEKEKEKMQFLSETSAEFPRP